MKGNFRYMSIYYIDRKTGNKVLEKVEGNRVLKWLYESKVGLNALELIVKRKIPTIVYGRMQDLYISSKKIHKFIKNQEINTAEIEGEISQFKTFNDFFTRKLKQTARPITFDKDEFASPADGRVFAYENIDINSLVQIKGITYSLAELLGDKSLSECYDGGVCIVVRLSPVDYHRFHYPDEGLVISQKKIKGSFYSVNPIALKKIINLYVQNKREYTIFKSKNFSDLVLMEIGATCVGSIIQHHSEGYSASKGEEKGFFKFGGSTVMVFAQKNQLEIDEDIISNTKLGFETKVNMGEKIASKKYY